MSTIGRHVPMGKIYQWETDEIEQQHPSNQINNYSIQDQGFAYKAGNYFLSYRDKVNNVLFS